MCSHDEARFYGKHIEKKKKEESLRLNTCQYISRYIYICIYVRTHVYSPMYKRRNSVRPRTLEISQLNNIKLAICLGMLDKTRINRFHEQPKNSSLTLPHLPIDTCIYPIYYISQILYIVDLSRVSCVSV